LGIGALWLEHPALPSPNPGTSVGEFGPYYPSFDPSDPRPPLAAASLAGELLASCATVEDAVALVRSHQLVAATPPPAWEKEGFCAATPECNPAIHFSVHDAQGNSIVIEFVGEASREAAPECFSDPAVGGDTAAPNGGRVCVYNNTAGGVMTNEPTLEMQRQLLSAQVGKQQGGTEEEGLGRLLHHEFGGYSSVARFGRLSALNTLGERASPACARADACGWSNPQYLPRAGTGSGSGPHGFSFESADPAVDRAAQAARQIGTVVRPFGLNVLQPGGTGGATQWTVMRGHTGRRYYFSSPAAPSFRVLDLASPDLGLSTPGGRKRTMPIADRHFDFEDVSGQMGVMGPSGRLRASGGHRQLRTSN